MLSYSKGQIMYNQKPADKPNVLFIISDDQGAWAMNCAGTPEIVTPNLDRLAQEGTRLENFFCASPVCSPARASLLTGRIPSQHGVQDWLRSGSVDGDLMEQLGINNKYGGYEYERQPIKYLEGQRTYTDVLAENGYELALSGKWHLGHSMLPQHGFKHWTTIGKGGAVYNAPDVIEHGTIEIKDEYITTLFTDRALDYMDTMQDTGNPWYMHVAYTAPHSPWNWDQHPDKWIEHYKDCEFESIPDIPDHPDLTVQPHYGLPARREDLVGYFAAVSAMDEEIGRILDYLDESGQAENTVIIFMSDNGMCMGHHGVWGKGNGTFPQNMYEESVKVPCIIKLPQGDAPRGQVRDELVGACDIYETIIALTHSVDAVDQERPGPGKDFSWILTGDAGEGREELVSVCEEYGPVRMIRTQTHKYVHRYPYGPHELYDLTADPGELTNLYDDPASEALLMTLRKQLDAFYVQYVDPEIDGALQPNTGFGQLTPLGKGQTRRERFAFEDRQQTVKQQK